MMGVGDPEVLLGARVGGVQLFTMEKGHRSVLAGMDGKQWRAHAANFRNIIKPIPRQEFPAGDDAEGTEERAFKDEAADRLAAGEVHGGAAAQ
jgi:hypothetical protein